MPLTRRFFACSFAFFRVIALLSVCVITNSEFDGNRTFAFVFAIYSLLPFEQMKMAFIRDISALLIANPFVLLKHLDFPEYWKDILIYSKDSKAFRALHGRITASDSAV